MIKKLSSCITLAAIAVLFTGVAAAADPTATVIIPYGPDATDYHNHAFTLQYCGDTKTASCGTPIYTIGRGVSEDNKGELKGDSYGPIDSFFQNRNIRFEVTVSPSTGMAGGILPGNYITTHAYAVTDQGVVVAFDANSPDWQFQK